MPVVESENIYYLFLRKTNKTICLVSFWKRVRNTSNSLPLRFSRCNELETRFEKIWAAFPKGGNPFYCSESNLQVPPMCAYICGAILKTIPYYTNVKSYGVKEVFRVIYHIICVLRAICVRVSIVFCNIQVNAKIIFFFNPVKCDQFSRYT